MEKERYKEKKICRKKDIKRTKERYIVLRYEKKTEGDREKRVKERETKTLKERDTK